MEMTFCVEERRCAPSEGKMPSIRPLFEAVSVA